MSRTIYCMKYQHAWNVDCVEVFRRQMAKLRVIFREELYHNQTRIYKVALIHRVNNNEETKKGKLMRKDIVLCWI